VIEKPIALDYEGVRTIYRAVQEAKVKTVTSFVLRWNPQFETVKQLQVQLVMLIEKHRARFEKVGETGR